MRPSWGELGHVARGHGHRFPSRGLPTRDIEAHLAEIYGVRVGRDLISRVTDAVINDVRERQKRPLRDVHAMVFPDALVLRIREDGQVFLRQTSSPLPIGTTRASMRVSARAASSMGCSVSLWLIALSAINTPPGTRSGTTML